MMIDDDDDQSISVSETNEINPFKTSSPWQA
jgi:hypothetical protein